MSTQKPHHLDGFDYQRLRVNHVEINFASAGQGEPLLLLHGYPQNHLMWHKIAQKLRQHFHVICADLRGYGDSEKPASDEQHLTYSKRVMATDMICLMQKLGFESFMVAGHDRGARVAHRLCLDYPQHIKKAALLDIAPTLETFDSTNQTFAHSYYHWFFLAQNNGLPERLIGNDPAYYLNDKLQRWSRHKDSFDPLIVQDYVRCFNSLTIHASCEDYRAAASIDLEHDRADRDKKITCPLLILWGEHGLMGKHLDILSVWKNKGVQVSGRALDCGHFLPEEAPEQTYQQLHSFFRSGSSL